MTHRPIRKAVIPAAGLGTRFLPATKAIPKEMLPIVDKPSIQLVVEEAVAAGITDIVLVTGRFKAPMEEHFDHAFELEAHLRERGKNDVAEEMANISRLANVVSVRQKQPLGLGHAVLCAKPIIGDEPFAVLLPDDLFVAKARAGVGQLIDVWNQTGASAVGVMEVPAGQEHLYGIVAGETVTPGQMRVTHMVEKPPVGTAPSRSAIIGRYVLSPGIWSFLERGIRGAGGEIQLTDGLVELAKKEAMFAITLQGERYDAGDKLGFLMANVAFAIARPDLGPRVRAALTQLLREKS